MSENVIKSTDLPEATKPAPAKKAAGSKKTAAKKQAAPDTVDTEVEAVEETVVKAEKSPVPEKKVATAASGKKFVFFSTGAGYSTKSGVRFTPDRRIYELDAEEADYLLSLENFRLPTQLELEDYYKENN